MVVAVVAALLAGVLGIAGSFIGAKQATDAADRTLMRQFDEDHKKEAREHRIDAYFDYLSKAEAYSNAWRTWFSKHDQTKPIDGSELLSDASIMGPYSAYAHALGEVYVYGSDEAWAVANEIDKTFVLGAAGGTGAIALHPATLQDLARYAQLIQRFRTVMCKELASEARKGC